MITVEFINNWSKRFEEVETSDRAYNDLISKVKHEISLNIFPTKDTFVEILKWKSPRIMGKLPIENFNEYYEIISHTTGSISDVELVSSLYGISYPTSSTILHFAYPELIPIVDVRTIGTLTEFNLIIDKGDWYKRTHAGYSIFCDAIFKIKQMDDRFTLRKIDRALFAYHAININNNPQKISNKTRREKSRITKTISEKHLTNNQFDLISDSLRTKLLNSLSRLPKDDMHNQTNVINKCFFEMVENKNEISLVSLTNKCNELYKGLRGNYSGKIIDSRVKKHFGCNTKSSHHNEINVVISRYHFFIDINVNGCFLIDHSGQFPKKYTIS